VFFLEEKSATVLLQSVLPILFPTLEFICLTHEGKNDLEASLERKLRAWTVPGDIFVVVRDRDNEDCIQLKEKLKSICANAGQPDALVRIVCQELEAWYIGYPNAVTAAFGERGLSALLRKPKFRDPDKVDKPSLVIKKFYPEFQKVGGARLIGPFLRYQGNKSRSFVVFIDGIANVTGLAVTLLEA
jgi:hypothetical protein